MADDEEGAAGDSKRAAPVYDEAGAFSEGADITQVSLKPWQFLAYELRLDLRADPPVPLGKAVVTLDEQGLRLSSLDREVGTDAGAARRAYRLHCECHRRQPPTEVRQAQIPFHLWQWAALAGAEALPEAYLLAVNGCDYVGLSTATRVRRLPQVLECSFTGVAAPHTGRGIGLAVKAALVAQAREAGYAEMRCTVLAANRSMLTINESLGFRRHREFIQSYPQLTVPTLLT